MTDTMDPARIGEAFQRLTAYPVEGGPAGAVWSEPVSARKRVTGIAPATPLPEPTHDGGTPLWSALSRRATTRQYAAVPMTLEQLTQLLWAASGLRPRALPGIRRTAPSAAAAYPIETYVVAHSIAGIAAGLYYHDPHARAVVPLRHGDLRLEIARICQSQIVCANAPAVLIWTAMIGRTARTCSQRGYRYVYIEAGHVAQNFALAATAMGLGSCQIGGFYDTLAAEFLGADPLRELILYMSAVGVPAAGGL